MKNIIPGFIFIQLIIMMPAYGQDGQELFKSNCKSCHTIGKGVLVGPDLANVNSRRSGEWLKKFIPSSQTMIKAGDPDAVALYKQFNETIMPDPAINAAQLDLILSYIEQESPAMAAASDTSLPVTAEVVAEGKPLSEATEADVVLGRKLFAGHTRFQNGGAACNSCHHVNYDGIMAGGALAKDLTNVYTRLNENGLKAVVGAAPFPVMQEAYKHKELTENEIYALAAFLQKVDKEAIYQQPRNYAQRFIYTGISGMLVLLVLFSSVWYRRKKGPVFKNVFNRQMKSRIS